MRPFSYPTLPATWYIGHMHKAVKEMREKIQQQHVDVVIEARDARLPLTSYNPVFERLVRSEEYMNTRTKRIVVYNKADLAQGVFRKDVENATHDSSGDQVLFTTSSNGGDVRKLMEMIRDTCLNSRTLGEDDKYILIMAGMPNVGKSTLLNALRHKGVRKGKAASTSSEPGHTRTVSNLVKISEDPPMYIHDSPGIMLPFLGTDPAGKESALKMALTGGIKEGLFLSSDVLIDYLLWRMTLRGLSNDDGFSLQNDFLEPLKLPPDTNTSDVVLFLEALARRLGRKQKGDILDIDYTTKWLIRQFRTGLFGRWTLDSLGRRDEVSNYVTLSSSSSSLNCSENAEDVRLPGEEETPPTDIEVAPLPASAIKSETVYSLVRAHFERPLKQQAVSKNQERKRKKEEQQRKREKKQAERGALRKT